VVAQGDHVDVHVQDLPRGLLRDAHPAGRVLAVDHHEVGLVALAQPGQQRGQRPPADAAHDVADKENPHRASLPLCGA
jgi:hypothetical protein